MVWCKFDAQSRWTSTSFEFLSLAPTYQGRFDEDVGLEHGIVVALRAIKGNASVVRRRTWRRRSSGCQSKKKLWEQQVQARKRFLSKERGCWEIDHYWDRNTSSFAAVRIAVLQTIIVDSSFTGFIGAYLTIGLLIDTRIVYFFLKARKRRKEWCEVGPWKEEEEV